MSKPINKYPNVLTEVLLQVTRGDTVTKDKAQQATKEHNRLIEVLKEHNKITEAETGITEQELAKQKCELNARRDRNRLLNQELEYYKRTKMEDSGKGGMCKTAGISEQDLAKLYGKLHDNIEKNRISSKEIENYKDPQKEHAEDGGQMAVTTEQELTKLKGEMKDITEKNKSLTKELDNYKHTKEKHNGKAYITKQELEKLNSELKEQGHTTESLSQQLEHYKQTTEKPSGNDSIMAVITNQELAKLKSELKDKEEKNTSLSTELETYNQTKEKHNGKGVTTEQELTKLKGELEDKEKKNKSLSIELEKNNGKAVTTEQELAKLKCELEDKEKKNKSLSIELEKNNGKGYDSGSSKAMDKLRQQNQSLAEEKRTLLDQMNELRNRLSSLMAHKITAGNSDIADMSDPYRPTRVAEQFRTVYDNEWTNAYEDVLTTTQREEDIIDFLANMLHDVDAFCCHVEREQFGNLQSSFKCEFVDPKYSDGKGKKPVKSTVSGEMSTSQEELLVSLLRDLRKSLGTVQKIPLRNIFDKVHMSSLLLNKKPVRATGAVNDFVASTLELVWMMKIQAPPMEFVWNKKGDTFDNNLFTYYTNRGRTVSQCVWPAVLLHKGGPLMSKGVAQGM